MKKSNENVGRTTVPAVEEVPVVEGVKAWAFQVHEDQPILHPVKIQLDLQREGKDLMTVDQVILCLE